MGREAWGAGGTEPEAQTPFYRESSPRGRGGECEAQGRGQTRGGGRAPRHHCGSAFRMAFTSSATAVSANSNWSCGSTAGGMTVPASPALGAVHAYVEGEDPQFGHTLVCTIPGRWSRMCSSVAAMSISFTPGAEGERGARRRVHRPSSRTRQKWCFPAPTFGHSVQDHVDKDVRPSPACTITAKHRCLVQGNCFQWVWSWAAGPSLQSPSSPNAPPSPAVPAVHDNRAGATPVALVHLPARIRGNRSVPGCARVKAVLGVPRCAQWGRAAAHHDVALGVRLTAPPAFTMVLDRGWGPPVESGQGRERSSVPQVPSLRRGAVAGPPGSGSGPVGREAGGQAPVGLLACSMQQARLPTITFVTMQLEPDY